jgi:ankyrin repeat protein
MLLKAVHCENIELVKALLDQGANVDSTSTDISFLEVQYTPLFYAVNWGNIELVKLLLDNGADINYSTFAGHTVLFVALESQKSNNVKMIKLLLERGAEVDVKDDCGDTPLHFAVTFCADPDIIKMLVENGSRINSMNYEKHTPLDILISSKRGSMTIIELLVAYGAKIGSLLNRNDKKIVFAKQQLLDQYCDGEGVDFFLTLFPQRGTG